MEKFTLWLEKTLLPIASWMKKEKHLKAITNSLMSCIVLLLIGGIACLIVSPPVDYTTLSEGSIGRFIFQGWAAISNATSDVDEWVYSLTIGMLSLWVAFGIGYYYAKEVGADSLVTGIIALFSTLTICCSNCSDGGLDMTYLSATGLFAAIIVSILFSKLYCFMVKKKIGYIKMPDGVPPAISQQFASLVPFFVVAILSMAINKIFVAIGTPLPAYILAIFQPLVNGADTMVGMTIAGFLDQLLWWFGIHCSALGAVIDPIQASNLAMNTAAYAAGSSALEVPYTFTSAFWYFQCFGYYIPLVIMLCFSKSEMCKTVGRVSIVPAIFNIGEPLLFGMPIVMNPLMMIPWILTRLVHVWVFGGLMKAGILAKCILYPTWTIPVLFGVYVDTFQGLQIVVMLVCMGIDAVIWFPFFKAYEKQCIDEENGNVATA